MMEQPKGKPFMDLAPAVPDQQGAFGDTDRQMIDGLRQAVEQLAGGLQDLLEIVKRIGIAHDVDGGPLAAVAGRVSRIESRLAAVEFKGTPTTEAVSSIQTHIGNHSARIREIENGLAKLGPRMAGMEGNAARWVDWFGELEKKIVAVEGTKVRDEIRGLIQCVAERLDRIEKRIGNLAEDLSERLNNLENPE
jgi:septation ring formation regulator EzrA